jgi:putative ABC transport system substrate-binding protein
MSRPTGSVLVLLTILAAAGLPLGAQAPGKINRVGVLATAVLPSGKAFPPPALAELASQGFVEGHNLKIEPHFGQAERLLEVARELVATRPDIILAGGLPAALALHVATRTIPVIAIADMRVETGLITSLARPGGNLSGVDYPELTAKRLELLRELMPAARRVALLHDPQSATVEHLTAITAAAQRLGFITEVVEAGRPEQITEAFQQARAGGAEAVNVINSPMFFEKRDILAAAAIEAKLPAFCQGVPGCVANYQPEENETFRIAGAQIARVLRGARIAELPVEQPTKFGERSASYRRVVNSAGEASKPRFKRAGGAQASQRDVAKLSGSRSGCAVDAQRSSCQGPDHRSA